MSPASIWPANRTPCAPRSVSGQFSAVDNLLTGRENLTLMADLHHLNRGEGRRRARELLDRFDLVDATGRMVATYSGGMRRRLDLVMTLIGDPRVIFLDEPTAGLDPRRRAPCGRSSANWWRPGSPSSSPPSTWRRPTSSPTASPRVGEFGGPGD
jgi:ABC-type nitrate/sulfonate/bicarbonate transport system ATPase subunit